MDIDGIIRLIEREQLNLLITEGPKKGEINEPVAVANAIVKIRMFLVQLVDKVAETELDYRRTKAARYDKFIKEGMKKSPAFDSLEMEEDLIVKKIETERVKGYMKYVDSLVSAVQSLLKVQTGADKGQY